MSFAEDVIRVIRSSMEKIQRPDLFRKPICGFSAADDPRYKELKTVIGPFGIACRQNFCRRLKR